MVLAATLDVLRENLSLPVARVVLVAGRQP
jgi:hypothetical protein